MWYQGKELEQTIPTITTTQNRQQSKYRLDTNGHIYYIVKLCEDSVLMFNLNDKLQYIINYNI